MKVAEELLTHDKTAQTTAVEVASNTSNTAAFTVTSCSASGSSAACVHGTCIIGGPVQHHGADILAHPGMRMLKGFCQHGDTTVYGHCCRVAETSVSIARALPIPFDERQLVRGALLHDYFGYDWHNPKNGHPFHAVSHPTTARLRAERDFDLTSKERDIISHHMFPLVPSPPRSWEAFVVTIADKVCSLQETVVPRAQAVASHTQAVVSCAINVSPHTSK